MAPKRPRDDSAALSWHALNEPARRGADRPPPGQRRRACRDQALATRRICRAHAGRLSHPASAGLPVCRFRSTRGCWFRARRSPSSSSARFAPVDRCAARAPDCSISGPARAALPSPRAGFRRARGLMRSISSGRARRGAAQQCAATGSGRRVRAVRSDHLARIPRAAYDIIVSNPPYVGGSRTGAPAGRVSPRTPQALAGGSDGLDSVRVHAAAGGRYLRPAGMLIVEVGNIGARRAPPVPGLAADVACSSAAAAAGCCCSAASSCLAPRGSRGAAGGGTLKSKGSHVR